jgi:hypothetical protein
MGLNDLIPDICIFETNLPFYFKLPKYFMDVGDLVLPRQHSIVTVKITNHHVFRVPTLPLQKLLIAILEQFLIILPDSNQQDQLQDHDSLAAKILEILLMLVIIRDIEDHKGEMVE